ncbi:MAG: HAD hydrolase-like protein [Bordetella sp.]|nr:MAG: HAD hydrolase-like protein [Bordetella sp.]
MYNGFLPISSKILYSFSYQKKDKLFLLTLGSKTDYKNDFHTKERYLKFKIYCENSILNNCYLLPGIKELLQKLIIRKLPLGIVKNKLPQSTKLILEQFQLFKMSTL